VWAGLRSRTCGFRLEVRPLLARSISRQIGRYPLRDINSGVSLVNMAVIVAVTADGVVGGEIDGRRAGRCG
jgi:hypothetical protein